METILRMYFELTKQLDNNNPLYLNDETSRYINFSFEEQFTNWALPQDQRFQITKSIPAKKCETQDFLNPNKNNQEFILEFFKNWQFSSIICPDLKED